MIVQKISAKWGAVVGHHLPKNKKIIIKELYRILNIASGMGVVITVDTKQYPNDGDLVVNQKERKMSDFRNSQPFVGWC